MSRELDAVPNDVSPTAGDASKSRTDAAAQPSRRRALLRAAGAAPAVLTLASNPVSAATCVVASSFVSALALASRKPSSSTPCSGSTPASWRTNPGAWPKPYCGQKTASTPATVFKSCFGSTTGTSLSSTSTMMEALGRISGSNATLAQYCVAALLNAQSGKVAATVVSPAQVLDLWKQVTTSGYYKPSASSSVRFTSAQCVTWLSSMMA